MITSSTFLLLMYYEAVTITTEKRSTLVVDVVDTTIDVVHVRDSGSRSCKLVEERQALEV
jgi:hypothetical protein